VGNDHWLEKRYYGRDVWFPESKYAISVWMWNIFYEQGGGLRPPHPL